MERNKSTIILVALMLLFGIFDGFAQSEEQWLILSKKQGAAIRVYKEGAHIRYKTFGDLKFKKGRLNAVLDSVIVVNRDTVPVSSVTAFKGPQALDYTYCVVGSGVALVGLGWGLIGTFYFIDGVLDVEPIRFFGGILDMTIGRTLFAYGIYLMAKPFKAYDTVNHWQLNTVSSTH